MAKIKFLADIAKEKSLDFIALLETGKKDFSPAGLNGLFNGRNFVWHWTEPHGRSGGILVGVNLEELEIGGIEDGDYFVKFRLKSKKRTISSGFWWLFMGQHNLTLKRSSLLNWFGLVVKRSCLYW